MHLISPTELSYAIETINEVLEQGEIQEELKELVQLLTDISFSPTIEERTLDDDEILCPD